nr:ABC transporter permease [uncultured Celeribacter sp.]
MAPRHYPPGFRRIFRRELRQIADRPALAFMLIPFPLVIFLGLAMVFAAGLPRALPVAVLDQDGSTLSRQLVQMVDAASDVDVRTHVANLTEARQLLLERKAYAILMIPHDMGRDLQLGQSPEVIIFSNNQFLTVGGIAARSIGTSALTFSGGVSVRTLEARGIGPDQAMDMVTPIPVRQSPLFNPSLDYIQFLLSSILPTVLEIFICAAAVLSFSRDHHTKAGMARVMRLSDGSLNAIIGKLAPYTLSAVLILLLGDAMLYGVFGASFHGNVLLYITAGILFVITCQFLGALIALIGRDVTNALGMSALIVAPAFGYAGVSFPRFGMTTFAQLWSGIIPLTPYLEIRTDQALRGTPVEFTLPGLVWLTAQCLVYGILLWVMLRKSAARSVAATEAEQTQ